MSSALDNQLASKLYSSQAFVMSSNLVAQPYHIYQSRAAKVAIVNDLLQVSIRREHDCRIQSGKSARL